MKIPDNYQTVMPYLLLENASDFIEYTKKVFEAKQTHKTMRDENIIMHAEIMIGESTIMFADATDRYKVRTSGLFVYVDDAEETYHIALENGGTAITELSSQSYGRSGGITDPFGNVWWITSVIQ